MTPLLKQADRQHLRIHRVWRRFAAPGHSVGFEAAHSQRRVVGAGKKRLVDRRQGSSLQAGDAYGSGRPGQIDRQHGQILVGATVGQH